MEEKETISLPIEEVKSEDVATEDVFYATQESPEAIQVEPKQDEAANAVVEELAPAQTDEAQDDSKAEAFSLELEENSNLDSTRLDAIEAFAKENNLSQEKAQELVKQEETALHSWIAKQEESLEEVKNGWRNSVIEDKVMGGENLEDTIEYSRKAVRHFGTEEFAKILNESGYGDHPEVVRLFRKLGKSMESDNLLSGKEAPRDRPDHELFYKPLN
jgi:hypothetical protein